MRAFSSQLNLSPTLPVKLFLKNVGTIETIYRSLFIQARGALKKELQQYLRTQRAIRRIKQHSIKNEGLGKITNAVSTRERPVSVKDRAVPGDWEGDLISGSK